MSQPPVTVPQAPMSSRPPRSAPHRRFRLARQWAGAMLLAVGAGYVLTLGTLRERFAFVPDLAWLLLLAALLGAGGAFTARGLALGDAAGHRATGGRPARRRLIALAAVLVGTVGLSFGMVSSTSRAEGWSDGERAAGAIAFCAALALVPFGATLLMRTGAGKVRE